MRSISPQKIIRIGSFLALLVLTVLTVSLLVSIYSPSHSLLALLPVLLPALSTLGVAGYTVGKSHFSPVSAAAPWIKIFSGAGIAGILLLLSGIIISLISGFSLFPVFLMTLLGLQNPAGCFLAARYLKSASQK